MARLLPCRSCSREAYFPPETLRLGRDSGWLRLVETPAFAAILDSALPFRYPLLMDFDWLRRFCLALPHTTEQIQWEDALVFKVGGRMYAVAGLEPAPVCLSFKCSREEFAELVERPGVVPAPYLARAHWAALTTPEALRRDEIESVLRRSYELVFFGLPRKTQASLAAKRIGRSRRSGSRQRSGRRSLPR